MTQFGSAVCDFDVAETQDGKHRLISVKLEEAVAADDRGLLTFELKPDFERADAETLTRMLKDWISSIRFERIG